MVRIDLDEMEWCENCRRATFHRTWHERVEGPGLIYKLRVYCQKCGRMKREIPFNWPHLLL